MGVQSELVYHAPHDSNRFGFRCARAYLDAHEDLSAVDEFCRNERIVMLVARCSTGNIRLAQTMERTGYSLMDTLVYCRRSLLKAPIPADDGNVPIRFVKSGDEETVVRIAAEVYTDYYGHYHADERLPRDKCKEVYVDWAYRSCIDRDTAETVLIPELNGEVVGFFTLRMNSPEEGEAVTSGVAVKAQRKGIYRSFMIRAMQYFHERGAQRMVVSTQIDNLAVQKAWARLGFEPDKSYYTFHKWYA